MTAGTPVETAVGRASRRLAQTDPMERGSTVVAVGALAVAALSLWLTYRERVAGLRGALYAKQIDVYGLVLDALREVHEVTLAFTTQKGFVLDGRSRTELREATQPQIAKLSQVFVRNAVFLPNAVGDALLDYRKTFAAISAPAEVESQYPKELVHSDDQMELSKAFVRVWERWRSSLARSHLAEQTLRLLGAAQR